MVKGRALTVALNSLSNFSGYAVSVVLALVSYPIIIDLVGIEAVGIYALIMAVLAPLDLTNLGFGEATIKYVAQYARVNDHLRVSQYISTTLVMSIFVGISGMIIISIFGPGIGYTLFDFKSESFTTIQKCFAMAGVGWLFRQITSVFLSIPIAFQQFKIVAVGNTVTSIMSTAGILVVLYFRQDLMGYVVGTLLGTALSLIFWYLMIRLRFNYISYSVKLNKEAWRSSFNYGGWQTLGSAGSLITNQADKYLLGIYLPASASGVYNVIYQMQQKILSAVYKIAEVLFPAFSSDNDGRLDVKFQSVIRSTYILNTIGVIVFFPFIILSHPILTLWLGSEFANQGFMVMQLLFLTGVFSCMTVAQSFFLMGNNKVKQITYITFIMGGATLSGAAILVPLYGLNGAAYGLVFAGAIRLVLYFFTIKTFFKENFLWYPYIISVFLPFLGGLAIFIFSGLLPFENYTLLTLIPVYLFISGFLVATIFASNYIIPEANRFNTDIISLISGFVSLVSRREDLKKE